jgi:hypothetical protein
MPVKPVVLALALAACAAPSTTPAQREAPARSGPYALELVDDAGNVLPTYPYRGRVYVLGSLGQRYLLRIRNGSGRRAEVVVSVDGRDVMDGRPASFEKRGYVVEPYGEVTIDGYRLSEASVAAFRFSSVPRSYAALKGDARDVGVIGVAVFPERPPLPRPYPPPYQRYDGERRSSERSEAKPGAAGPAEAQADAAPRSAPAPRDLGADRRPGLGTEFGEEHDSSVYQVSFERASARPEAVLTVRYDDRPGLLALGIDVDRWRWAGSDDAGLRERAEPFRRSTSFAEPPAGWRGQ